jgi:hypothetical protein
LQHKFSNNQRSKTPNHPKSSSHLSSKKRRRNSSSKSKQCHQLNSKLPLQPQLHSSSSLSYLIRKLRQLTQSPKLKQLIQRQSQLKPRLLSSKLLRVAIKLLHLDSNPPKHLLTPCSNSSRCNSYQRHRTNHRRNKIPRILPMSRQRARVIRSLLRRCSSP